MEAPPTPVSPTMAPSEKKEKKRKRDKDPEKNAKKQKREGAQAADSRLEDGREAGRIEEKKRKRKEKKSKSHGDAQPNGVQAETTVDGQRRATPQAEGETRAEDTTAIPSAHEKKLQDHSPFIQRTTSLYLPLSPCAANFPLEGLLAEHISPLLLTYYPPLQGVLLSYSNARLSETPHPNANAEERVLTKCTNEYAVTFVWLTADFLLFRPQKGTWMEGHVRLGNESMIGLVCYNYFNAVIEKEKMPRDWSWVAEDEELEEQKGRRRREAVESAGYFQDGEGKRVEGRVVFRVEDFEALVGEGGSGVSVMGSLLEEGGGE